MPDDFTTEELELILSWYRSVGSEWGDMDAEETALFDKIVAMIERRHEEKAV